MIGIFALLMVLFASPAFATIYYVATPANGGSDSNPGTQASPWANPQKCTQTPVAAGDTCLAGDGTYTDTDNNGIVVWAHSVSGTSLAPITIKSLNRLGAKIIVPGNEATNPDAGFYISANYFIIDGFDISGGTATTRANHGIAIDGATGTIVRNNAIHNIARTVCSNSTLGNTGIFFGLAAPVSTTIDSNTFYSIGRLRNGESGCVTTILQHDQGMYIQNATTVTVTRNRCWDTNRGFCIQFNGGTVSGANVWNNTFADGAPSGIGPAAQIILAGTINTSSFKNNISYNSLTTLFEAFGLTCTAMTVDYNLSNGTDADLVYTDASHPLPGCLTSGTHNLTNANPQFTNPAIRDYSLTAGSPAIDSGIDVGLGGCVGACDRGALEFAATADTTPPAVPQGLTIQ